MGSFGAQLCIAMSLCLFVVYKEKNDAHWAIDIQPPHGSDVELKMLDATLVRTVDAVWMIMWFAASTYNAGYDDQHMRLGRSSNASLEKSAKESPGNRL